MHGLSLMILHVQTFWKAIIAWFSTTNNIIPLHCSIRAHLIRPKFNNPLLASPLWLLAVVSQLPDANSR